MRKALFSLGTEDAAEDKRDQIPALTRFVLMGTQIINKLNEQNVGWRDVVSTTNKAGEEREAQARRA